MFMLAKMTMKSLMRKKMRTLLVTVTIALAFAIYGLADAIDGAFTGGRDLSKTNRLITNHRVSLTNTMPINYAQKISAADGVISVTYATWFGGYYQDERNQLTVFAVEPQKYIRIFEELIFRPDEARAFVENRNSAAVGRAMATAQGWKLGDQVQMRSNIWRTKEDTNVWQFEIAAIFDGKDATTETNLFLINHSYFDESRSYGNYTAGWFSVKVEPSSEARQLTIARSIDALFANSDSETKTVTEQAFLDSFARQYADIGLVLKSVMVLVVATLVTICTSTIVQSASERRRDFAVLRTLGFSRRWIATWITTESAVTVIFGALAGYGLTLVLAGELRKLFSKLVPEITWGLNDIAWGMAVAVAIGVFAALFPLIELSRSTIVATLNKR